MEGTQGATGTPLQAPESRPHTRALVALVVALAVSLATLVVAFAYLPRSSPPRYLTMTEYYDLGDDRPDSPHSWPALVNGTVIRVEDRIVDVYTDFGPFVTLVFPYTGLKYATTTAFAVSSDNFCHYGINDTVRLVGTVTEPSPGSRGVWGWSLEEGSPPAPTATLGPPVNAGSEVRIAVSGATGECKGVHLRVQLWQDGFAVDGMFLRYDGIRGVYLRYEDADGSGTLTAGDLIRVVGPPAGSLEVHLYFRGTELSSVAWTSP